MTGHERPDLPVRFEHELRAFLETEAGLQRPDYLPDVLVRSIAMRQRAAWTFPNRWLPMSSLTTRYPATAAVPWRAVAVLITLALLAAALGLAYVGSRPRLPAPYGLAGNGLVAYASGGDIFIAEPTTGASRSIVTGTDDDLAPLWSNDGTRIAFVRNVGPRPTLFVVNADGSGARKVADDMVYSDDPHELAWSADGSEILFRSDRSGGTAVVVAKTDGSGSRVVTPDGVAADSPSWQPGTGAILYRAADAGGRLGLRLIAPDGTEAALTPFDGEGFDYEYATWSPDGARIASMRSGVVHVIDVAGRIEAVTGEGSESIYPDWSPDGRYLTFMEPADGRLRLAIADLGSGTGLTTFGVRHGIGPVFDNVQNAWSPDGTTIIARIDHTEEVVLIDVASGDWTTAPWRGTSYPAWQRLAP